MSPKSAGAIPKLSDRVGMARRAYLGDYHIRRAIGHLAGPLVAPQDGIAWLARRLVERVEDKWDSVAVWTGEEGSGKSTGMLRLIDAIETVVGRPFDWRNLGYGARAVLNAYERASPMDTVWFDEGSDGLWAGDTFDPEQEVLTKLLTQARVRGVILLVAIPDINLLAKKVRGRRAAFWVHVTKRGTPSRPAPSEALVHERDRRLRYRNSDDLRFSLSDECPDLTYAPYAESSERWRRYSTEKERGFVEAVQRWHTVLDKAETKRYGRIVTVR